MDLPPIPKKRVFSATNATFPGSELSPDEAQFGSALERYKREHHRPHPTYSEVLHVLLALGYRKP
jgi:hypothetical protein